MNPADHAWWLASRASGIVAILLVTATVFMGLTLSTRVVKGPGIPKWISSAHEQLALTSLVAIALHGVTLLGDPFLKATITDIAVPFAGDFKRFWVGIGIVGGYVMAALGLSYYVRKRIGAARWRKLHRFTIVGYVLSLGHTIGAGTDKAWLTYVVLAPAGPILVLFLQRMLAGRKAAAKPARAADPAAKKPARAADPAAKPAPAAKPPAKPRPSTKPATASQGS